MFLSFALQLVCGYLGIEPTDFKPHLWQKYHNGSYNP